MAKRNPSALKAHRQNVVRREHNRELRSKLRTGLKAIRAALDDGKIDGREGAAHRDHLAGRQDGRQGHHPPNTAGRYKSRMAARLKRQDRLTAVAAGRRPLEHVPHNSTTSRSSTYAARRVTT